jgi:chromosome segregation ATPase
LALLQAKLQLDKAQKEYDLQLQKQAIKYADNLEKLKDVSNKDLLRSYNKAYQNWASLSDEIYQKNFQIGQLQLTLMQDKATDQQDVTDAKAQLDNDQADLVKLNEDLSKFKAAVPNVDAVNQLIAQYKGEINTLTNENTQLEVNINVSKKNYDDLNSQITLFNQNTLNPLWTAQTDAADKVQNAKAYLDAATNYLNNTSGLNNVYDFVNKTIVPLTSGYQPRLNGAPDGSIVAIKDAVTNETDDASSEGVYPSPSDQKDVADATGIYNKAKKYYDDAKANYDNSFATWQSARDAVATAQAELDNLTKQREKAGKNIDPSVAESDQGKYNRNSGRITSIQGYINNLTVYLTTLAYTDPETNAPELYAFIINAITSKQMTIKFDSEQYDAAEKSYEQQKPMFEIDYTNIQNNIDLLTADVASEEKELALLKATLDEWTAKLSAAIPVN